MGRWENVNIANLARLVAATTALIATRERHARRCPGRRRVGALGAAPMEAACVCVRAQLCANRQNEGGDRGETTCRLERGRGARGRAGRGGHPGNDARARRRLATGNDQRRNANVIQKATASGIDHPSMSEAEPRVRLVAAATRGAAPIDRDHALMFDAYRAAPVNANARNHRCNKSPHPSRGRPRTPRRNHAATASTGQRCVPTRKE